MGTDDFDQDTDIDLDGARSELESIGKLADAVGKKLSSALQGAILNSKYLKTVLLDVGKALADIALKMALKPVGEAFGALVNSLFTATNPVAGVSAFAKGGVVATPSYFPMSGGGLGLMGEAGAEAILPLARGADGRLGVRANNASAPIHISMVINTPDATSFVRGQAQVNAMLARAVGRGRRSL